MFLLTALIILSSFEANACPKASVINQEVATASSYKAFDTAMNQYGGLIILSSPFKIAQNNWTQFQANIAHSGFIQAPTQATGIGVCGYHSFGKGYTVLKLGGPAPQ